MLHGLCESVRLNSFSERQNEILFEWPVTFPTMPFGMKLSLKNISTLSFQTTWLFFFHWYNRDVNFLSWEEKVYAKVEFDVFGIGLFVTLISRTTQIISELEEVKLLIFLDSIIVLWQWSLDFLKLLLLLENWCLIISSL